MTEIDDTPDPSSTGENADRRASPPTSTALSEELEEVQRQRNDYLDQLQRTRADFINYQKRAKAQAEIDRQYAISVLANDLLNVLDNLERAKEAARTSGQATIVEGLELVHKQFLDALAKHGVEPIPALGLPFDPNYHEALSQQPDASKPDHTIIAELSRGYRHHDRVLRPSRVAISIKPS